LIKEHSLTLTPTTAGGCDPESLSAIYYAGAVGVFYVQSIMRLLTLLDSERAKDELEHETDLENIGALCYLLLAAALENFDRLENARRNAPTLTERLNPNSKGGE
jgi:NADH:ubiquinone oxidoreductase subunit 6 (subunit J)